jgi:hypothetical protein
VTRPVTRQGVRDLNDPPRNARTRNEVVAPPAKATRCQHAFERRVDGWGHHYEQCIACPHIRGERTGRWFR